MSDRLRGIALLTFFGMAGAAGAQEPLSASDWLSGSVRNPPRESSAWRPGAQRPPVRDALPTRTIPPVAESGAAGNVTVSRLDRPDPDMSGTIAADVAGLPADLWQGSDVDRIAQLIAETPARLPSMNALMHRLLLAQMTPPRVNEDQSGLLFLARADRLLGIGDVQAARNLLKGAGPAAPETFRRLFDIALLEGDEPQACALMDRTPGIAPSFAARIFCLAQSGDWSAAALAMHGAETLGLIDAERIELLHHFLDDAYVDLNATLTPPDPVTPLDFRMHEAIGQPLPTATLPLAFAHSDLRQNGGWKARIEAAERLVKAGALGPKDLHRIYGEQKPAASGGVWERAAAVQAFDQALADGDPGRALPEAFDTFAAASMGGVLASMIAGDLAALAGADQGQAGEVARWLTAWQGVDAARSTAAPQDAAVVEEDIDRKGEALLQAMADVDAGLDGGSARAASGLQVLRDLGLSRDADLAEKQLQLAPQMMQTVLADGK